MIILSISVAIAILGTTLAAMNTGVRISFAMAQDDEMPEVMGLLHGKYATPHMGVWIMVLVSGIIGAIGVNSVVALTGITLASNLGTFVLYGIICGVTVVAFQGTKDFKLFRHGIIPGLGLIVNVVMILAIFIIGIASGGTTAQATYLALGIAGVWLAVSVVYFVVSSRQKGKHIIPPVSVVKSGAGD
jgi:amino acid transporter